MKRKIESSSQVEAKIPSLSSFLKEENLNVDDIQTDVDEFIDCYNQFVRYISEILDKKEKANPMKMSSLIIKFKELNRKAQFRLNISRDKTKETKDAINKNHLAMQNLLYEALHLEKETNLCLEFKSLHEDIDLIPLDEFLQTADESLKEYTTEHELTLNRLHWELIQRKNLSGQISDAEQMEKQLLIEINKKRIAYNEISTHLKSVFDTTKPLENIFDMPMHHQEEQNQLVELLPEPLYVLYLQMKIQSDLDEQFIHVDLVVENNTPKVIVTLKVNDVSLILSFVWNSILELVSVLPSLDLSVLRDFSAISKCFLESSSLLSELPGDTGSPMESPWVSAKLEKRSEISNTPNLGFPYLWCQRISGNFSELALQQQNASSATVPDEYPPINKINRVSSSRPLSVIIQDIRDRLQSRLELANVLEQLSTKKEFSSISTINNWVVSSYFQFKSNTETKTFVNSGLASEQCFYFTSLIKSTRYQEDEIYMWLVVPYNYPENKPIVVINKSISKIPGQEQLGSLSMIIHLLEVEVNCYCNEFSDYSLNHQISRLLFGIDKMLDFLHDGHNNNKLGQILVGNKFPVSKRPFKSLAQLNPLFGPVLEGSTVQIMRKEWKEFDNFIHIEFIVSCASHHSTDNHSYAVTSANTHNTDIHNRIKENKFEFGRLYFTISCDIQLRKENINSPNYELHKSPFKLRARKQPVLLNMSDPQVDVNKMLYLNKER